MRMILLSWEMSIISAASTTMAETLLIFGVAIMEENPLPLGDRGL
jgi:hypothetical protein